MPDTSSTNYQRQYSHNYALRLLALRSNIPNLDHGTSVGRIIELREGVTDSIVAGTIVRGKKSERAVVDPVQETSEDEIALEDESGRVYLVAKGDDEILNHLSTGTIVAVRGVVQPHTGIMEVTDVHLPSSPPLPLYHEDGLHKSSGGHDPHVMFLSGLECGVGGEKESLSRQMLLSYLQGLLTTSASKVCRVVVAGGGCGSRKELQNDSLLFGIKELDLFISQLCASGIPVDYLPSQDDPTTVHWPQRPLHACLLPKSNSNMFFRSPNPYEAVIGNKLVTGTDGANVRDLVWRRNGSELDALAYTLDVSHLCPTGPDSVPTIPCQEEDPFCVTTERPHLYFAGNCTAFATREYEGTRLVCIPKFVSSNQAILVNLVNLSCDVINFRV